MNREEMKEIILPLLPKGRKETAIIDFDIRKADSHNGWFMTVMGQHLTGPHLEMRKAVEACNLRMVYTVRARKVAWIDIRNKFEVTHAS